MNHKQRCTIILLFFVLILLIGVVSAAENPTAIAEESQYDQEFHEAIEEDVYDDIGEVKLEGDAGLTPDSNFYFLESLVETVLVGDDPETALQYKEEKVLELKEMVQSGDKEGAEKALSQVEKYNDILQKEVSPDIEKKVRSSSKAVKEEMESFASEIDDEGWDDLQEGIEKSLKQEDKIALAAKISNKIAQLCKALSDLDPLEYSKACSTGKDDPRWKRDLDQQLTEEQRKEAEAFFGIMSECFQNPESCRCDEISVKPFAEQCALIAPLAAACSKGNEEACQKMEDVPDPIDLLPDYLREVMEKVEEKYGDAKHDLHLPEECAEAGATSQEACFKVMFKLNAPPECQEALESGRIDPQNEREARKACEEIMFTANAPEECLEAGLKDHKECERFMFKEDAPEECLSAGLTGSGRDDWKKCEAIRFKLDAPEECLDAGIDGSGRDDWKKCDLIRFKLEAAPECLDAGLDGSGRDDWKKCGAIQFKMNAPQECIDAGLDGSRPDHGRKCEAISFKANAPQECLDAGLDGSGRDDMRKCGALQFKTNAPQECLDAGLDGSRPDHGRKCEQMMRGMEGPREGPEGEQRGGDREGDNFQRGPDDRREDRRDDRQDMPFPDERNRGDMPPGEFPFDGGQNGPPPDGWQPPPNGQPDDRRDEGDDERRDDSGERGGSGEEDGGFDSGDSSHDSDSSDSSSSSSGDSGGDSGGDSSSGGESGGDSSVSGVGSGTGIFKRSATDYGTGFRELNKWSG